MDTISLSHYSFISNTFSFTFATMMAASLFFWLNLSNIAKAYRPALIITGLVTFIAAYHYMMIMVSFKEAFSVVGEVAEATGVGFNDAYRYVDWLLTVPLLLIELILVMNLSQSETVDRATKLGLASALMIILGYPGEIAASLDTRLWFWVIAMIPFLYIVYVLFFGLRASISQQPTNAQGLVYAACWVTILSWAFYPVVYLLPNFGFSAGGGSVALQVGYSIADIVSKAVFGVLIYLIAVRKSAVDEA